LLFFLKVQWLTNNGMEKGREEGREEGIKQGEKRNAFEFVYSG
jgi:predicted transposase YdaD